MNIKQGHSSENTLGDVLAQKHHMGMPLPSHVVLAAEALTIIVHQLKQHAKRHKLDFKHCKPPFNMPRKDQGCFHCISANVNITFIYVHRDAAKPRA